jgi:hypothetical protein
MDFWTVFAAVIAANLLTVMFVWGIVTYSRHEREGTPGNIPWAAFMMPLLFALAGIMIATDSVPAWLEAISQ